MGIGGLLAAGSIGLGLGGLFGKGGRKTPSVLDILGQQVHARGQVLPTIVEQQREFAPQFTQLDLDLSREFSPQFADLEREVFKRANPERAFGS